MTDQTRELPDCVLRSLEEERGAILIAQRLAALDPDIRMAMSATWWAALRVGMTIASHRAMAFPNDPFGALEMTIAREADSPSTPF